MTRRLLSILLRGYCGSDSISIGIGTRHPVDVLLVLGVTLLLLLMLLMLLLLISNTILRYFLKLHTNQFRILLWFRTQLVKNNSRLHQPNCLCKQLLKCTKLLWNSLQITFLLPSSIISLLQTTLVLLNIPNHHWSHPDYLLNTSLVLKCQSNLHTHLTLILHYHPKQSTQLLIVYLRDLTFLLTHRHKWSQ